MERIVRLTCPFEACDWSYEYNQRELEVRVVEMMVRGELTKGQAAAYIPARIEAIAESHAMCVHGLSPREEQT